MTKIIIVLLMVCGQPDVVIVKQPNETPVYTTDVYNPAVVEDLEKLLRHNPEVIIYEEERGTCS